MSNGVGKGGITMAFIYKAKRICTECRNDFISVEQSLPEKHEYDPEMFTHQVYVPEEGESLANKQSATVECPHCYADNSLYFSSVIQ